RAADASVLGSLGGDARPWSWGHSMVRERVKGVAQGATFASLRVRNYRVYFAGQLVSITGVWIQVVALAWLVLALTGSGTSLGLVTGSRFLPILLLGPWGGLLADRMDKRTLLVRTQSVA